jgi:hypothetical protein
MRYIGARLFKPSALTLSVLMALTAHGVASAQTAMGSNAVPSRTSSDQPAESSRNRVAAKAGENSDDTERSELSVTWRPTIRSFWLTYENDEQTWEERAFVEKTPESVRLHEPELGRFELFGKHPLSDYVSVYGRAIGGPRRIRLFNEQPVQSGVDVHLDSGITFVNDVLGLARVRTYFGAEFYRWWFDASEVPGNSHLGLVLALQAIWGNFSILFEGRLSALPLLYRTPLGGLSDASTLRNRVQYEIPFGAWSVVTGMEAFHTKTDFFGSQAVPGHSALAIDDIQLSLTTGVKASF